ncbi:MAG: DUF4157 domain-containing protein, partial [Desulfobacterales bacterium]|nr:DUF4157 domain-containing protein [Desulfobacterales bacterium]
MKTQTDKIQEQKNENSSKVQQEFGTGGNALLTDNRASTVVQRKLKETMNTSPGVESIANKIENKTGLPIDLKTGMEKLSGYSMDDVRVHYNSSKPAQLKAYAFAQGTNIHLGPRQEKHLAHELGHVVQQKRNEVTPTFQLKGKLNINDDPKLENDADRLGERAIQLGSSLDNHKKLKTTNSTKSPEIIQGYFFNGAYQYPEKNVLLEDLRKYLAKSSNKKLSNAFQITTLTDRLWAHYGQSNNTHMEMEAVISACNKVESFDANLVYDIIKNYHESDINLPATFPGIISKDERVGTNLREAYIERWENKRVKPVNYKRTKFYVNKQREKWEQKTAEEVDQYFLYGKSMLYQDQDLIKEQMTNAKDKSDLLTAFQEDFTNHEANEQLIKPFESLRRTNLDNFELQNQRTDYSEFTDINNLMPKLEDKILSMRNELYGVFYYNDMNDGVAKDTGIKSLKLRSKEKGIPVSEVESNTSGADIADNSDDFVFMFIEHKDASFNIGTRFAQNQNKNAIGGRRRKVPLSRL